MTAKKQATRTISHQWLVTLTSLALLSCSGISLAQDVHAQGLPGPPSTSQAPEQPLAPTFNEVFPAPPHLAPQSAQQPALGAQAITGNLVLRKGLRLIFPIRGGVDTRWKRVGDYDFIADVEYNDERGYRFRWHMTPPANAAGLRSVDLEDMREAHKVSLFYPDNEQNTLVGYTSIVRVSDLLYAKLRQGEHIRFSLDGPESPQVLHKNTMPIAHELYPVGVETMPVLVDNKTYLVSCIHAQADTGWSYWILDNPQFPIILKGDGPFHWDTVAFTYEGGLFPPSTGGGAPSSSKRAKDEARRVVNELEKSGKATSYLILFDFDSDRLRPLSKEILTELSAYLREKPNLKLRVEGHTCTIGGRDYNLKLSDRRARSVKRFLISDCGLPSGNFVSVGYGFSRPAASNKTDAGRRRNRRVVFQEL